MDMCIGSSCMDTSSKPPLALEKKIVEKEFLTKLQPNKYMNKHTISKLENYFLPGK